MELTNEERYELEVSDWRRISQIFNMLYARLSVRGSNENVLIEEGNAIAQEALIRADKKYNV